MLAGLTDRGSFLAGLAVAWAVAGLAYLLPRLVRSGHRWSSAVLFSSLSGSEARLASLFAGLSACWLLVLLGAIYSPLAALASETLPFPGGIRRAVVAFNLWLIVIAVPLLVGAGEAVYRERRLWGLFRAPAGFVQVGAIAAALVVLLPWVLLRRVSVLVRRRRQESLRLEVEVDRYREVVEGLADNLLAAGLPTTVGPASWSLRLPRRLVDTWGPPLFRPAQPYVPCRLAAPGFELTVYATLFDIVADPVTIGRARLALWGRLPPLGLWWTWSREAREVETAILRRAGGIGGEGIARRLARLEVGAEEWRALNREFLLSRAGLSAGVAGPG